MEDTIRVALARWRDRQPNMGSESFRNNLAEEIALLLREKGTYTKFTKDELSEKLDREIWVCDVCGESTYDVEYDYIGSGTNHLGCELELEMKEKAFNQDSSVDKLSEEIIDSRDIGYIYESPDSGKTIYRRKMGESKKELVDEDEWERARKYHGDSW